MAFVSGNPRRIPQFVSASNPKTLMRAMLSNNFKANAEYQYFDITFDGKRWFAWYYKDFSDQELNDLIQQEIRGT
jgi:hypothetical protein